MVMSKSTFLAGFGSSLLFIIGILMKTLHWPGAGVVITVAVASFSFGYAVLFYLDKNKLAQNSTDKLANIMTMVAMIGVAVPFLFKAMHWPGAGILIYVAHFVLFALIAVLYVQGLKEADTFKKLHYNNMAIVLTIITAISLYIWWRTSGSAVNL
jgi:hypothetical protein